MICNLIKVRVKPDQREKFLEAIEYDALHSEADEPGCLRFNVVQAADDPNLYYFIEMYTDEAAVTAHRAAPHYDVWAKVRESVLEGPVEAVHCNTVFPKDPAYWSK